MTEFAKEREATITFNDVHGQIPVGPDSFTPITDFDAELTDQVGNTGHFRDAQYGIGQWPALGDYGAVLLDQLRGQQIDDLHFDVDKSELQINDPDLLHPDLARIFRSLGSAVVGVVNSAPRTKEHHEKNQNGEEFYGGVTKNGVEIFAQLPYFRGLNARGNLRSLFRVPNDARLWTPGEQFRSSVVSRARRFPERLEEVDDIDSVAPSLEHDGRLAYVDRFGNVRLEVANVDQAAQTLVPGGGVRLRAIDRGAELKLTAVTRMTDIAEGELGIYHNPADPDNRSGAGYLELVRRVSDPNNADNHAYASLRDAVVGDTQGFKLQDWEEVNLEIDA